MKRRRVNRKAYDPNRSRKMSKVRDEDDAPSRARPKPSLPVFDPSRHREAFEALWAATGLA